MPLIESRHRVLFLGLFAVFTLVGTSATIIGATLPRILADFHWNYVTAGVVIGAGAVTYFAATFAAGYLIGPWGPKPTIGLGLLLAGAGLACFAATPSPVANTLLSALMGLGQGCIEVGVNTATLRTDPRHTGRPMNLMHGAFAVGAILGPLAVSLLMRHNLGWILVYRGMAVLFALLAVMTACLALPRLAPGAAPQTGAPARRGLNAAYLLAFIALFLYVGVELGFSNWVAAYFVVAFGDSPAAGALLVSLFWTGLLAGRFGVPLLYRGARRNAVLVGFALLATGAIALLSLLGFLPATPLVHGLARGLVFCAGLGCSIYYPMVITLLCACFPQSAGQAIGFAASGGGIGSFLFPFIMAAIAQRWGIRTGFTTYALLAAAMVLAARGLAARAGHQQPQGLERPGGC